MPLYNKTRTPHAMSTRKMTGSMSGRKQSTIGSSGSLLDSSARVPINGTSSVEPPETSNDKTPLDKPLRATVSETAWSGISEALGKMDISKEEVEPPAADPTALGSGDSGPANSPKDSVFMPSEKTAFDMDVGKFLKDRLDGHVTSYPLHDAQPWPPGVYPAVPSICADSLEGHEFLWAEAAVFEKNKFNTKPQSLKSLEKTLTRLCSEPNNKKPRSKKQKQTRAFKRSLRAHRLRLETLAICAKRIADTVREIYEKRENDFFMNEDEREKAGEIEFRVWRIRVASRRVRWLRRRSPEYEALARDLKEIILLEISKNKNICRQLRERYRSVVWGQKGWKADVGLLESDGVREEWDSERSEEGGESDEYDESEDTEDESEVDYDDEPQDPPNSHGSKRKSGGGSGPREKKIPFIRLVVRRRRDG
ncbi:unnamed protein product [Tuber aestivum]|uniref:Uncharacterized protein n=1 Tax=Tuber aestivum TaxID=59557 RepID=A0A292QAA1_9PEZI|nr:unnamed protein product [Tuber aestivum]